MFACLERAGVGWFRHGRGQDPGMGAALSQLYPAAPEEVKEVKRTEAPARAIDRDGRRCCSNKRMHKLPAVLRQQGSTTRQITADSESRTALVPVGQQARGRSPSRPKYPEGTHDSFGVPKVPKGYTPTTAASSHWNI
ncbi:hypothetical protein NPX13_g1627 [Xylaria arbuscula]|uniref:Uncharacterized protein n=1 Tax=Xylaria arbuscula TaxID=114810 RepID=A0A9W8TPH3_9PEZI|nr:hypothetical protein NPX13_g1627 [Xylaria arbuscula]